VKADALLDFIGTSTLVGLHKLDGRLRYLAVLNNAAAQSRCCWALEYSGADFACIFSDGPQLRLKIFYLNAESFLEILRTQKLFQEVMVCRDLPPKVRLKGGYSLFIGTRM
jgi:hypothetical protein